MFYSHEILTSRKHGVATVWLVATLGAKSTLKKINRKAILDVDVPKACETILTPEAPMALRLQSNLLYGVSRVYSQQVVYVLSDAQTAQNNMRNLLKVIRTSALDPEAGIANPDQLILQDDPAFLPDFILPGLDMDFSVFDNSISGSSQGSGHISAISLGSSRSSVQQDESILGLVIPTSDSGNAANSGGFALPGSIHDSARHSDKLMKRLEEDDGFLPDIDLNFDAEGNMLDEGEAPRQSIALGAAPSRMGSDSVDASRVRREHEEGFQAGQLNLDDEMDVDWLEQGNAAQQSRLPAAEPFPEAAVHRAQPGSSSHIPEESEESIESAVPIITRKVRGPKVLPMDVTQELRNADLVQWQKDYLVNMAEATHAREQHKLPYQAKKNAFAWVFGNGIGGIGRLYGSAFPNHPLAMFAGDSLKGKLTGKETTAAIKKRGRDSQEPEESDEERRVRAREDDGYQIGRGGPFADDDNGLTLGFDDEIEIGRDAAPLLEDHSSQMPWNISASVRGSRQGSLAQGRGFPSSAGGFPTSAAGPSNLPSAQAGIAGAFDRRASRITSASPLVGRGPERHGDIELPQHHDDDDEALLGGRASSDDHQAMDDFQLYGPAAGVDTQTAAQSQWMKATLNQESGNFLEFIRAEIEERVRSAQQESADVAGISRTSIAFDEILPPEQHSATVAAQGFHHVLTLATKGLIDVEQLVGYGPIRMGLVAGI